MVSNILLGRLMAVEQDIFRIEGSIARQGACIATGLGGDLTLSGEVLATLQDSLVLAHERRSLILRSWR
jgi:hypothetical protein